jgi:hypothetical protein
MEFGGCPAQNIEPDSDHVRALRVARLLQVESLSDEEVG